MTEDGSALRILEALLFVSSEPVSEQRIAECLPPGSDIQALTAELADHYSARGIHLRRVGSCWAFRTAPDVMPYLGVEREVRRDLSQAAVETLAIIAYHQPVTRAEIEEIRGKSVSGGTLEILSRIGWVNPKGRRQSPGRPTTWGTTQAFLDHFYLQSVSDLPDLAELKAAGFLDARPAAEIYDGFSNRKRQSLGLPLAGDHDPDDGDSGDDRGNMTGNPFESTRDLRERDDSSDDDETTMMIESKKEDES